jgi:itaconate CoA-transferase
MKSTVPTGGGQQVYGGPLTGTTVVGLEHSVAGPLCTRILADLGAEVIKVERPGGDFSRHWDRNAGGEGAQFWWLNRRKQGVVFDLRDEGDRGTFDALLGRADVLVHNMSPEAAGRLGLDAPELLERCPRLVNCQITGYGTGAYGSRKAYDMLVQAEAGMMSLTGTPDQPTRSGVSVCDVSTGIYAAVLVLAALRERDLTGRGRYLEVAMFDAASEFIAPMLVSFANSGVVYPRIPDRHHAIAPYGAFECSDGRRLLLAVEQDREWALLCDRFIQDAELGDDPRFATNADRLAHRLELEQHVAAAFERRTADECAALFDTLEIAYARLNDMAQVAGHPVTAERGMVREVESADGASVKTIVGLAERAFAPRACGRERPPQLGEDTAAVAARLAGINPEEEASHA